MIICEVCGQPAKYQYVKVAGHNLCMDCAVTRTVDDMMTELGLSYENVPDELEVEYTVKNESGVIDVKYEEVQDAPSVKMDVVSSYPSRMGTPADVADGPRCEGMSSPDDCKDCLNNCYGDSAPVVYQDSDSHKT